MNSHHIIVWFHIYFLMQTFESKKSLWIIIITNHSLIFLTSITNDNHNPWITTKFVLVLKCLRKAPYCTVAEGHHTFLTEAVIRRCFSSYTVCAALLQKWQALITFILNNHLMNTGSKNPSIAPSSSCTYSNLCSSTSSFLSSPFSRGSFSTKSTTQKLKVNITSIQTCKNSHCISHYFVWVWQVLS